MDTANKTHIFFLSTILFLVLFIYYMFGKGSAEGFGEIAIPKDGIIPVGFYKVPQKNEKGADILDESGATLYNMKSVPYGYISSPDKLSIIPSTQSSQYSSIIKSSDPNEGKFSGTQTSETNYNPIVDLSGAPYYDKPSESNLGVYYFYDKDGNLVASDISGTNIAPVIYYIPGSYKYGASNYVPNYEDSVYMSRTTRQSTTTPVFNTSSILGGFCAQNKGDTNKLEEKCNALDLNACASTSCCVLLGGQKCVAGNDRGPTNPANYSDFRVVNKDVYYYQGKCYGNCM